MEYAREVFLVQTTDYFSYSFTKQKANPYKVYAIDPGLYNAVSFRFSENIGRIFENVVYLALRRKGESYKQVRPICLKELEIASVGKRPNTRYGVSMDKAKIKIVY